ncbi:MAG: hypothetical protein IJP70_05305 [Bacteroidales bacterium]|nr:hypothetical protein [Bacteroidales bacterium]
MELTNSQWVDWSMMPVFPSQSGTYVLLLRQRCTLPLCSRITHHPVCCSMQVGGEGFDVLYIGETDSLRQTLDYDLINGMAYKNDIRRSLGALFGFRTRGRKSVNGQLEQNYTPADEYEITDWIRKNTYLIFWTKRDSEQLSDLINTYDPPLNYTRGAASETNAKFMTDLLKARNLPIGAEREIAYWNHNGQKRSTDAERTLFFDRHKSRQDKDFWMSFIFALSVAIFLLIINLILWSR